MAPILLFPFLNTARLPFHMFSPVERGAALLLAGFADNVIALFFLRVMRG